MTQHDCHPSFPGTAVDVHGHYRASSTGKHISVCICTYKRPAFLKRLLEELGDQVTGGLFTYSIVVADNDYLRSAEPIVLDFATKSNICIKYCMEPRQNIAMARNKVVGNAVGDLLAFIDDDEFPEKNWLLTLFRVREEYAADGVLGPVRRYFNEEPPKWIARSSLYERPIRPTGAVVKWEEARTGNVLLKTEVIETHEGSFKPEFRAGEDQDFFRRMIEKGHRFVWSAEGVAYEVVPPARWKRTYLLRKALLRGASARLQPTCGLLCIAKSVIAVPAYVAALPLAFALGHHRFMTLLVKLFDHLGKLLAVLGLNPIKEQYIAD